jgi:hypothetical protein
MNICKDCTGCRTAGELLSNEECLKTEKGWYMKQGNLTYASMLTTIRDMMGFKKITEIRAGRIDLLFLMHTNVK